MSREILDLGNVIDSYDTLKVKDKTFKVGSVSTESILKMEKIMQDMDYDNMEINELEENIKKIEDPKEKKKALKDLTDKKIELQLRQVNAIPEQIHLILSEFNDVTIEEIKAWGINAQLKFMEWFNQPFLDLSKTQAVAPVNQEKAV